MDTTSAISSPGSADGPSPLPLPAGTQLSLFGPDLAPASPSPQRGSGKAPATSATSGPRSSPSSASAALTFCLGSRLEERLGTNGSMEYALTWSRKATPSGLRIFRLRASARRTSGAACSGWPTPQTADINLSRGGEEYAARKLEQSPYPSLALTATLAAGPLAGWATPIAGDAQGKCNETASRREGSRHHSGQTLTDQLPLLAGWGTPTVQDAKHGHPSPSMAVRDPNVLTNQVQLTDWKNGQASEETMGRNSRPLNEVAVMLAPDPGTIADLSSAATASRAGRAARLSPAFSLWLMGYPRSWLACGLAAAAAAPIRSRRARRSKGGSASSGEQATP